MTEGPGVEGAIGDSRRRHDPGDRHAVHPGRQDVDLELLDRHVAWLHDQGIRCLAPLGTNGEGPSLSLDERRRVIERIAGHPSGIAFLPGTGCSALPETIELSRFTLQRGAAAVLVAPPCTSPPSAMG